MRMQLTPAQLRKIMRPIRGRGGFQALLRRLQRQVEGNILTATDADIERLIRYSFDYGEGGFQERTKAAT